MDEMIDAISFDGELAPTSCMLPSDEVMYEKVSPVDDDTEFCFLCSFNSNNNYHGTIRKMEDMLCGKSARKTRPRDRINNVHAFYELEVRPYVLDPNGVIGCGDKPEWTKHSIKKHSDFHDNSPENTLFKQWAVVTESSNLLRFHQLCIKTPSGETKVDDKGLKNYEILMKLLLQLANKLDIDTSELPGKKRKRV